MASGLVSTTGRADGAAAARPPDVILVVGDAGRMPIGDTPVVAELGRLGAEVTVVDDDGLAGKDLAAADLVIVSSSVVPTKLHRRLGTLPVPVMTWEPYLFPELGLTSDEPSARGETASSTRIRIANRNHPIAARLTGDISVSSSAQPLSFGVPVPAAEVVAVDPVQPDRAVLFTLEAGAAGASGVAPARRVGAFMSYLTPTTWNADAKALFAAAVSWASPPEARPANTAPVVDPGQERTIEAGETILLDGAATDDGFPRVPGSMTTIWRVTGPEPVLIAQPLSLSTTAMFPSPGTYEVSLSATDGELETVRSFSVVVSDATRNGRVMFVAGNAGPPGAERHLVDRLKSRALTVDVVDDDRFDAAEAAEYDLVLIASSVQPSRFDRDLAELPVPIVTWEAYVYDELGLGRGAELKASNLLTIDDPDHPVTAGLGASVSALSSPGTMSTIIPRGGAEIIASVGGRPVVAAWDNGDLIAGGRAPARRVVLFPTYGTSNRITQAGLALLDSSVTWALDGDVPRNVAPTVDAGPGLTVAVGTPFSLDGLVTDDGVPTVPGRPTATWTVTGPAAAEITDASDARSPVILRVPGSYDFTLTADDGLTTSTDTVQVVAVDGSNTPPTVDVGPDLTLSVDQVLELRATVVDDGRPSTPGTVSLDWSSAGPGATTFTDRAAAVTSATFSVPGTYHVALTANDGILATSDALTVVVTPTPTNRPPTVSTNGAVVARVGTPAPLSVAVTDDGLPSSSLTVTWSATGPGTASFESPTAAATKATFDTAGTYEVLVTATDGALTTEHRFSVTVQTAATALPPSAVIVASRTSGAPHLVVDLDGTASTDNDGKVVEWAWDFGDGATAQGPRVRHVYTRSGVRTVKLTVTDDSGSTASTTTVVTVSGFRTTPNVALIVGAAEPDPTERSVGDALASLGYPVRIVDDDDIDSLADIDAVVVMPSARSRAVSEFVVTTTLPVITADPSIADELGLGNGVPTLNGPPPAAVDIRYPAHPLAAGLSGTVTVSTEAGGLPWIRPAPSATTIAALPGRPDRVVVSALDIGGRTPGGSAASRRVALLPIGLPGAVSIESVALLRAAIGWVYVADNEAPTVDLGPEVTTVLDRAASLFAVTGDDGRPGASPLRLQWSGPPDVVFSRPTAASTSATFPREGTFVVTLTVSDGQRDTQRSLEVNVERTGRRVKNFTIDERNGTIFDPKGRPFLPVGANFVLGDYRGPWWSSIDGPQFTQASIDSMKQRLGINIVRLMLCNDQRSKCLATNDPFQDPMVLQQIELLTENGIVAWIDNHTIRPGSTPTAADIATARAGLASLAERYRNNPYVWFEPYNEPGKNLDGNRDGIGDDLQLSDPNDWRSSPWWSWHGTVLDAIRATGNDNIVLLAGAGWSQDKAYRAGGYRANESAVLSYGASIVSNYDNVGFDLHFYDRWSVPDTGQIARFVTEAHGLGVALVIGEIGWNSSPWETTAEGPVWQRRSMATASAFYSARLPGVGVTAFHGRSSGYGFPDLRTLSSRPGQPQAALFWDWANGGVAPCSDGTRTCTLPD